MTTELTSRAIAREIREAAFVAPTWRREEMMRAAVALESMRQSDVLLPMLGGKAVLKMWINQWPTSEQWIAISKTFSSICSILAEHEAEKEAVAIAKKAACPEASRG